MRTGSTSDLLKSFKAGAEFVPLKSFLFQQAQDFHSKNVAKTYVAVKQQAVSAGGFEDVPGLGVLGYMTLTCSEIDIRNGYTVADCQYANKYDSLPAAKIARLAVDTRYRGNGIGEALIALSIAIATDVIAPIIGCRFVVTDAKIDTVPFYTKVGFTLLDTPDNRALETPVMFVDIFCLEA